MPQNTNLNVSPYFDDFDSSKNFSKVLFKPGTPVQARELTTLQSILQGQIEKFGKHMFKEGSVVIPGVFKKDVTYSCVKVESTFFGVPVELYYDKLVGLVIQGRDSGVTAQVVNVLSSTISSTSHTTLYIKYNKGSDDLSREEFIDGENLTTLTDFTYGSTTISSGSDFATAISSNANAIGSAFTVTQGVWFVRGTFVEVQQETLILDQYTNQPTYRVGFFIKEELVTAVDDNTLYDNAAGYSNYTAPGADRFRITLSLGKKDIDDFNDENFIELLKTREGVDSFVADKTIYGEIAKEWARRTYDESGDYYVRKFDLEAKECLNDRYSVFGTFFPENKTEEGNDPSKDLLNIRVGAGKAYVKGYETEVYGTRFIDVEKPRTTELVESSAVPFEAGNKLRLNNVLSAAQIKLDAATSDYVDLRSARLGSTKSTASGSSIGRARIYDYKLQNAAYVDATSVYELFLFDIQTDVQLTVNQAHTIALPAIIEGARSGAKGFLRTAVSGATGITLNQVVGSFVVDEPIIINGVQDGRVITAVTDYDLADVKAVRSTAGGRTFAADVVLEPKKEFTGRSFSITSGGVVTCGTTGWVKHFRIGDVVAYKRGGQTDITYNVVSAISPVNNNITVVAAPATISGICHKALPSSTETVADLKIIASKLRDSKSGFLYAELPNTNIESVDLTDSLLQIRVENTAQSTDGSGQLDLPSLTGTDYVYAPFDEERYTVVYTNGTVAALTSDQVALTGGAKGVTISGLTASQSNNVIVHSTQQKSKVKSKQKTLVRSASLLVTGSNRSSSGITTALGDGLTPSSAYGLRVQDREISLNVPDVVSVAAVFESSGTGAPVTPSITLGSYNGPNNDNTDLILGEIGIGKSSGAAAKVMQRDSSTKISVLFMNHNIFEKNEEVTFEESGVKAVLGSVDPGDPNIRNNFILDNGQRSDYYDFGRLVRKQNFPEPQGRLQIFYDYYIINSQDSGDVLTVNSYTKDSYDTVPAMEGVRNTDAIDLRPRVANHTGGRSPFEFDSRDFSGAGQNTAVLVSDENLTFDYSNYLGRIDRLYVNQDRSFSVKKGTPAVKPAKPEINPESFELAIVEYKPYVYDPRKDVKITFTGNKRYTMKDIGALETRIENIEEVTALSLLESKTESLVITDPTTGLDRFKNGFVVDPFNNFDIADKKLGELKYDIRDGKLVARKNFDAIDLLIGSNSVVGTDGAPDPSVDPRYATDLGSPNIVKTGDICSLAYTESPDFSKQPFATRVESINPYAFRTWGGRLSLNPSSDVYVDRIQITRADGIGFNDDFISQTEPEPMMREQNIAFTGTRLKPGINHYNWWSGTDMIENNTRTIPKLLEVTPIQGAFQIGETVSGTVFNSDAEIRFRLASPNHKDGPYNSPTLIYTENPYGPSVGLSSAYSETTSVLNIDCQSLNQKSDGNFFGYVTMGMRLVGENSGAEADVSNIRLVSDNLGAIQGSYYIPGNEFQNGTNTARLASIRPQDQLPNMNFSRASVDHESEGFRITETTLTRVEPVFPPPIINNNTFVTNNITNIDNRVTNNITEVTEIIHQMPQQDDGDPLAQSFFVTEETGVCITAIGVYFQSKSASIPVTCRIVKMVNGYPSREIAKHGEAELNPDQVVISNDASLETKFTFPGPVYLPEGEYAFIMDANTADYNLWISQMGEAEITTANLSELGQVIVAQQPSLGSLFKGQTRGTWTASQLEDMKYNCYKAEFTMETGTVRLYNPQLGLNQERNRLPENPIEAFAKRVTVGLTSSVVGASGAVVDIGTKILQNSNAGAEGIVTDKLAHLGTSASTLSITNAGAGYEDATYSTVNFTTVTGKGSGAVGVVTVSSGAITGATVKGVQTGSGYQVGDTITAALGTKGLGQNLVLTVGVTTGTNALILTGCTNTNFDTTNLIQYYNPTLGYGVTLANIKPATVTVNTDQYDGKHFKVTHPDHGNHAVNNLVRLNSVSGDSVPTKLTVGYGISATSVISIGNSTGFGFFEGANVSASNPGYALLGDEIVKYTSVGTNQLSGTITRGIDDSISRTYVVDDPIQKYELSGVSLRKINTQHNFAQVTNTIEDKITLDQYHCKIDGTVAFTKDKHSGGTNGKGSTNIQFETVTPNIIHRTPPRTRIEANLRTTTGTSVSGTEASFVDKGYQALSISGETKFSEPRIVASKENEDSKLTALPGSKSLTLDVHLSTNSPNVSPTVDVFRSSLMTESSRVNSPIANFITDRRANTIYDPHELLYLTKVIKLDNPATGLKVIFAAYRPQSSTVRVLYRLFRADSDEIDSAFQLMPGYDNLNASGDVINAKSNSGLPDRKIVPSLENQFIDYEFTVEDLPQFTGFQVKVDIGSTSQAEDPELLDFRAIATA
tara:strand:- start:1244 stop:8341 length:7098 start_codon:yes stop_codon:yes gene_type:complete